MNKIYIVFDGAKVGVLRLQNLKTVNDFFCLSVF